MSEPRNIRDEIIEKQAEEIKRLQSRLDAIRDQYHNVDNDGYWGGCGDFVYDEDSMEELGRLVNEEQEQE